MMNLIYLYGIKLFLLFAFLYNICENVSFRILMYLIKADIYKIDMYVKTCAVQCQPIIIYYVTRFRYQAINHKNRCLKKY